MQGLIPKSVRCEVLRWHTPTAEAEWVWKAGQSWGLHWAMGRAGGTDFCLALQREAGSFHPPLLGPKLEGRESMSVLENIFLLALSNKILQCAYYHLDAWGSPSREFYLKLSSQGLDFAPRGWCQKQCAELKWTMIISRFFKSPVWYLPLLWVFFPPLHIEKNLNTYFS